MKHTTTDVLKLTSYVSGHKAVDYVLIHRGKVCMGRFSYGLEQVMKDKRTIIKTIARFKQPFMAMVYVEALHVLMQPTHFQDGTSRYNYHVRHYTRNETLNGPLLRRSLVLSMLTGCQRISYGDYPEFNVGVQDWLDEVWNQMNGRWSAELDEIGSPYLVAA